MMTSLALGNHEINKAHLCEYCVTHLILQIANLKDYGINLNVLQQLYLAEVSLLMGIGEIFQKD